MANAPEIYGPDGVLRTEVMFSTSMDQRFFSGTVAEDAVDVQVSVNGSGYSADPSLVFFSDGTWVVPNPAYEPDGIYLQQGDNTFAIRAILPSGTVTPDATATVRLVSAADIGIVASPPTNISLDQKDSAVVVKAESSSVTGFRGMNYYASQFAGGGADGYTRINVGTVSDGTITEETSDFGDVELDANVVVDAEGNPLADPLFFRLVGTQQDEEAVLLQSDLDTSFEVPETARKIRLTASVASVRDVVVYEFSHNRKGSPSSTPPTVSVGTFGSLPSDRNLYYVIAAVYFDSDRNIEYESSYSEEVVGRPMRVTAVMGSFPATTRTQIVTQFIGAIFRSNPQIKAEAGSVLRDTVIDPFSSESERLRFVMDFLHRARTPTLLLQVDDPKSTGTSLTVAQSAYKQGLKAALYLASDTDVQGVINSAFDAYAGNFGVIRKAGIHAQGEVTFFTSTRPTNTMVFPIGTTLSGGTAQFMSTRAVMIDVNRLASFYNPISGNYTVNAPVRASAAGTAGNVGAGQIKSFVTKISGANVTNIGSCFGGEDNESNLAFTGRILNALASVDSGTARGYLRTAADTPGIVKASVVAAGDPMMQRDIGNDGVHRGGKVDVWVQGSNPATVTDTFAFAFDVAQDIQFEVIGDPADLLFQAVDTELSTTKPIVELLDYPDAGYEFRNVTSGETFDLTDATLPTYNTVQLSTDVDQPSVTFSDVVLGSYRRRTGNTFVLPRQPVGTIVSVDGTVSGSLPEDAYSLVFPDPPLGIGRSSLAQTYLDITGYTDSAGDTVPSGDLIAVEDESHTLIGQYPEYMDNLGVNFLTVRIYNEVRTIEYKGPNDPSGEPDFTINLGTETTAVSITRVESGDIASGETVSIDYSHDENFTVSYTTNLIVSVTQDNIDENKHATADVIVKEGVEVPLDVSATIILVKGVDRTTVDSDLRTDFTNFFGNLRLGDPVRQSDVIRVIEETVGVSYVVVPLNKQVRQEGSTVVREEVSTDTASESVLLSSLSTATSTVYILTNSLAAATVNGGGSTGEYRGVFQDDEALTLLDSTSLLLTLGLDSGRTYIIGADGAVIDGFSDDETLTEAGYVTDEARLDRRIEITANRVLVSFEIGDSPTAHTYAVTYIVGTDDGAKDIDPNAVEYISEGEFVLTYDQEQ